MVDAKIEDADQNTIVNTEESADEDKIRFDTGGSERMIIDDSGNVGIGTANPSGRRFVIKATGNSQGIMYGKNSSDSEIILTAADSGGHGVLALADSGGDIKVNLSANSSTNNYINNGNNVGIGTTSPNARLHVRVTDTTDLLLLEKNANTLVYVEDSGNIIINDGDVGIGTTNPRGKLDVVGAGDQPELIVNGYYVGIGTADPDCHLHVNNMIKIEPLSSQPTGALGRMYIDDDGRLHIHDGSNWRPVAYQDD
ncbi:MAG: hypothetical protein JXJ19_06200 [Elusimicrobia bacterium]|nr:hypothetical protein [Elusimicrobiota bacterium]